MNNCLMNLYNAMLNFVSSLIFLPDLPFRNRKYVGKNVGLNHSGSFTLVIGALLVLSGCLDGTAKVTSVATTTTSPSTPANHMGINIDAPADWSEDRTFADIMKTARAFTAGIDPNGSTLVAVDANGWPMQDFSFYAWAGILNMYGTYTLTFNGKATVTGRGDAGVIATSYDIPSNTSTGTIVITPAQDTSGYLSLSFANTQATNGSATNTGVTNIKLMRPNALGSSTSFPSTTLFNTPLLAEIANFSAIRFMDWFATNWSQQVQWSDRPLPTWATFNICSGGTGVMPGNIACKAGQGWQGIGAPIEYAVMLANQTNKDMWINIPVGANNTYITNVAKLLLYGSDGTNPYSSVQSSPAYPPLNSNLNIYIEYSNEVWNSSFAQMGQNCQLASDELVAGHNTDGDPTTINFDGLWGVGDGVTGSINSGVLTVTAAQTLPTDQIITGAGIPNGTKIITGASNALTFPVSYAGPIASETIYFPNATYGANSLWNWDFCFRRQGERTVQISTLFRAVFGDAAMMTRVRPVMESQFGNPGADLQGEVRMLLGYYDNLQPTASPVGTPHPPSYYIYGAGGSAYYNPTDPSPAGVNNDAAGLTTFFAELQPTFVTTTQWGNSSFQASVQADAALVSTMGVKRVAYEGGPSLDKLGTTGQYLIFNELAQQAVADSRMTSTLVAAHNLWAANGGDLLMYFTSVGDQQWGFTESIFNLSTPKLAAITSLNAAPAVPVTFGTTVPGSISGLSATYCEGGCYSYPASLGSWDSIAAPSIISAYKAANNGNAGNYSYWWSYTFNSIATTNKTWTITLTFNNSTTSTVDLYVDGVSVGTQASTNGASVTFTANSIAPGLHSIIATSAAGSYNIKTIAVSQN